MQDNKRIRIHQDLEDAETTLRMLVSYYRAQSEWVCAYYDLVDELNELSIHPKKFCPSNWAVVHKLRMDWGALHDLFPYHLNENDLGQGKLQQYEEDMPAVKDEFRNRCHPFVFGRFLEDGLSLPELLPVVPEVAAAPGGGNAVLTSKVVYFGDIICEGVIFRCMDLKLRLLEDAIETAIFDTDSDAVIAEFARLKRAAGL